MAKFRDATGRVVMRSTKQTVHREALKLALLWEDETRRVSFTNSAEDAVRDLLNVSELTDGSDLYIWDRHKKAIVARIEWIDEPTTFGNTLRVRLNQFYDSSLAEIARHLCERADIRHAIVNSVAI